MASRLPTLPVVALTLLLAACTEPAATTPTVPPDVFAPTPSIETGSNRTTSTTRRVTTTIVNVERATIYPVDPLTLETLPGFEPITMGDWVWGRPSPDGSYFAASIGDDRSGGMELRLIDIADWELSGSWRGVANSELYVTDDGTIFFYSVSNQLQYLQAEADTPTTVAELPTDYYVWGLGGLSDGMFAAYGAHQTEDGAPEKAAIMVTEIATGIVEVIDLPEVRVGNLALESNEPWAGYLYSFPTYVFDQNASRALVTHADEGVVSEVDLVSGTITEHELRALESGLTDPSTMSLERSAQLSPSGNILYVATTHRQVMVDDNEWSVIATPVGLVAIDTTTWQVVSNLDESIGYITLSPGGDRILATGYTATESPSVYEWASSSLYLIQTTPLSVQARHEPANPDYGFGSFSFNEAAGVGYATTWETQPRVLVIDLKTGEIPAEATSTGYLEMIGPISVMSETR